MLVSCVWLERCTYDVLSEQSVVDSIIGAVSRETHTIHSSI